MQTTRARVNWPAALALAGIVGLLVYQSQANRPVVSAQPSAVATVDLPEVFKNLLERSAVDVKLQALFDELDEQGQTQRAELDSLAEDLELYSPTSRQYEETTQKIAEKGYRLQAFREFAARKLEVERSRALRDLYAKIKDAARDLSDQEGYHLVLVDDSVVPLPTDATEAETWRQISARRTIYANPNIDITDQLLTMMNDRFSRMQDG